MTDRTPEPVTDTQKPADLSDAVSAYEDMTREMSALRHDLRERDKRTRSAVLLLSLGMALSILAAVIGLAAGVIALQNQNETERQGRSVAIARCEDQNAARLALRSAFNRDHAAVLTALAPFATTEEGQAIITSLAEQYEKSQADLASELTIIDCNALPQP